MFGKGKKEKDITKMLEGLTPEEMQDLQEAINGYNESQKGNATNETNSENQAQQSASENEKSNEVAKTTDDTTPADNEQHNAIPIENVMLKSDFDEYVKKFEERLNGLANENEDLKKKNQELEKQNGDLKEKYENNSFGNYKNNATNGNQEVKPKETFKDYTDKFFK